MNQLTVLMLYVSCVCVCVCVCVVFLQLLCCFYFEGIIVKNLRSKMFYADMQWACLFFFFFFAVRIITTGQA